MRLRGIVQALAVILVAGRAIASSPVATVTVGPFTLQLRTDTNENFLGRFNLGHQTIGALLSRYPLAPSTGFATIRIGGSDFVFGDQNSGSVTTVSQGITNGLRTVWQQGAISVRQDVSIESNPTPGTTPNCLAVAYTITNNGGSGTQAGVRLALDVRVGDAEDCRVCPNGGAVVTGECGYQGSGVPGTFWIYDQWPSPNTICYVGWTGSGVTAPDEVVVADYWWAGRKRGLGRTLWTHPVNGAAIGDTAMAFYWNPVGIGPGQNRTFEVYYGLPLPGWSGDSVGSKLTRAPAQHVEKDDPSQTSREKGIVDARASLKAGTIRDLLGNRNAVAYPNPATGRVTIAFRNPGLRPVVVRLYSFDGQVVAEEKTNGIDATFPVAGLAQGVYFWTVRNEEKALASGIVAVTRASE